MLIYSKKGSSLQSLLFKIRFHSSLRADNEKNNSPLSYSLKKIHIYTHSSVTYTITWMLSVLLNILTIKHKVNFRAGGKTVNDNINLILSVSQAECSVKEDMHSL